MKYDYITAVFQFAANVWSSSLKKMLRKRPLSVPGVLRKCYVVLDATKVCIGVILHIQRLIHENVNEYCKRSRGIRQSSSANETY